GPTRKRVGPLSFPAQAFCGLEPSGCDPDDGAMAGGSGAEELAPRSRRALEAFVAHLRDERGLSPNTVVAYERDVAQFFRFAARAGVDDPDRVDPLLLRRFLALLRTRGLAAASLGRKADRKSTRLNSSHDQISYAVFCLKKKTLTRAGYLPS